MNHNEDQEITIRRLEFRIAEQIMMTNHYAFLAGMATGAIDEVVRDLRAAGVSEEHVSIAEKQRDAIQEIEINYRQTVAATLQRHQEQFERQHGCLECGHRDIHKPDCSRSP